MIELALAVFLAIELGLVLLVLKAIKENTEATGAKLDEWYDLLKLLCDEKDWSK